MDTFGQILEMDDDEDREFSKSIIWNYFEQAGSTFVDMATAL
jgi:osomolarity two-component system, phosphorelay intermediate protein YPD1